MESIQVRAVRRAIFCLRATVSPAAKNPGCAKAAGQEVLKNDKKMLSFLHMDK